MTLARWRRPRSARQATDIAQALEAATGLEMPVDKLKRIGERTLRGDRLRIQCPKCRRQSAFAA